jgi:molybdopterin-guanine dinucleotide biosynthesis protein A
MCESPLPNVGGIVLCGGKSTRMGAPKLSLPFGNETMLERVVRILGEVVSPIVVVASPNQKLPSLPEEVLKVRDEREERGPMEGLAAGLSAFPSGVQAAYVSSCDVPLLSPDFVRRIVTSLEHHDMAIPRDEKYHHPLAAVYRTRLVGTIRALIAEDLMRPYYLLEKCDARVLEVNELREVDPNLDSLRNMNTPEEYQAALKDAGFNSESAC